MNVSILSTRRQRGGRGETPPGLIICRCSARGIDRANLPVIGSISAQVGNVRGGRVEERTPGAIALVIVDQVVAVLIIIGKGTAGPRYCGAQPNACTAIGRRGLVECSGRERITAIYFDVIHPPASSIGRLIQTHPPAEGYRFTGQAQPGLVVC